MFYKEKGFIEIPTGRIPKDWISNEIYNMFDLYKGTTPSTKISEYWDGNIPFVKPTDITSLNELSRIYLEKTEKHINKKGLKSKRLKFIPENSLLLTSRATIGSLAINKVRMTINQGIIALLPKKNLDVVFYYYFFQNIIRYLESLSGGSTFKEISVSTFKNIKIPFPPLHEQRKVATILSTVDEAIRKVDEVIAKTERLKKSLMQELLTKGIGHKEFKDTKIGKIPKDWEIAKLGDVAEVTDGSHWSPKEMEKSEYRIATVANLKETYIDINSCKFISKEDYTRLVKEEDVPKKGDILFSKDGTVGICFVFKQDEHKIGLLSSVAIIRPSSEVLFPDFGAYALKSPHVFQQIIGRKTGTALKRIILKHLKMVKIPLPPLPEQEKITEILLAVDKKLDIERREKGKLERIKQGLMFLLLTGKIRVKVS